jgi:phenylacetate-CoA ligase
MSVQFTIGNFGHPVAIWKLHRAFDVSQWFSSEQFLEYQRVRLRIVLGHAYATVPYYHDVFQRAGLTPADIRDVADLQKLPILTKGIVRREGLRLQSAARHHYRPQPVSTSGTTGEPICVLLDKPSNVLEFAYYWRHWGWAGYRLGTRFAELSADSFLGCDSLRSYKLQPGLGRLLLNSMAISNQSTGTQLGAMRRYRPRFLKGLASALHYFSIFARESNLSGIQLRAVFSTGEMLLPL